MNEYKVVVFSNGDRFWYKDSCLHRNEGPAVERISGDCKWYLFGHEVCKEQFDTLCHPPRHCYDDQGSCEIHTNSSGCNIKIINHVRSGDVSVNTTDVVHDENVVAVEDSVAITDTDTDTITDVIDNTNDIDNDNTNDIDNTNTNTNTSHNGNNGNGNDDELDDAGDIYIGGNWS